MQCFLANLVRCDAARMPDPGRVCAAGLIPGCAHLAAASVGAWLRLASAPSENAYTVNCNHPIELRGTIYMLEVNHKHKSLQDQGCTEN